VHDTAASSSGHSAARHGAVLVFHPLAATHTRSPPWSLDEMARADPAARPPGREYEQGQPAAWREQHGEEPANRAARQSGARERDKTARIGKASGFAHRSLCPDAVRHMSVDTATHRPTVTHPDIWRDKKGNGPPGRVSAAQGPFSLVVAGVGFEPT